MKKVNSFKMVRDMFEILADNEYSLLWDLVDDFEINGHKVSIKDSTQFKHVIIDNGYCPIGGKMTIRDVDGVEYKNPLDFAMSKLEKRKEDERMNFGDGSIESIREAIGMKVEEDAYIKEFQPGSDQYKKLEAAAALLTAFGEPCKVKVTYFDYGQGWKWTTVIQDNAEWGGVQILTPRDQENILKANSPKDIAAVVDKVLHNNHSSMPNTNSDDTK